MTGRVAAQTVFNPREKVDPQNVEPDFVASGLDPVVLLQEFRKPSLRAEDLVAASEGLDAREDPVQRAGRIRSSGSCS